MIRKLLFFFLFFLFFTTPSFALENFTTDYDVIYKVQEDSLTNVNIAVALKNNTEHNYASSYKINLGFKDVYNLTASDDGGKIDPKIVKTDDGSEIELTFNKKVVGEGNKLNFRINFNTREVAESQGSVWEVNIPGIFKENNFSSFDVEVIYPSKIGKPSYIKPEVYGKQSENKISFNKQQLGESGISIAFGENQVYEFDLRYNLQNKNLFPVTTDIALPPNTNYQEVIIEEMNPKPKNVTRDRDGNWLAEYYLSPSKKLTVNVRGKARVSYRPKSEPISKADEKEYILQKPYWEVNNSKIKKLGQELKTPEAIYKYVTDTLTYDFDRVTEKKPRLGSLKTLEKPNSAVCLEFTDLFVAIARAAGIPARELNGYANTQNQKERPLSLEEDVLHAWPEYYDYNREAWIMVDPTWGNTTGGVDYFRTFDFDHIVFAIKGRNSSYPVPAGGYKLDKNAKTKDINVILSKTFDKKDRLVLKGTVEDKNFSFLPIEGSFTLVNEGNSESDGGLAYISSTFLTPNSYQVDLGKIPPFGYKPVEFKFDKPSILTNKSEEITILVGSERLSKKIFISPLAFDNNILIGGGLVVVLIGILSFTIIKSRRLSVSKQKESDTIRREG